MESEASGMFDYMPPEIRRKAKAKLEALRLRTPNELPEHKLREMHNKAYSHYKSIITRDGGGDDDTYAALISEVYSEKEAVKAYAKERGNEL